ncbi:hypothetical protein AYX14_07175 [Cryptococcus neoformans]|nr:hypothetical protein AYX14_07175 [Cryptococcus neoformans var. grubii]
MEPNNKVEKSRRIGPVNGEFEGQQKAAILSFTIAR